MKRGKFQTNDIYKVYEKEERGGGMETKEGEQRVILELVKKQIMETKKRVRVVY
jgi:hypothetical protein